jgi:hypothetical protein
MSRYAVLPFIVLVLWCVPSMGYVYSYTFTYSQSTFIHSKISVEVISLNYFNFSVINRTNGIWVCLPQGFSIKNISLYNFTISLGDQVAYNFPYYNFYTNSTYYGYIVNSSSIVGKILINVTQLNETPRIEKISFPIFNSSTETSHSVNYSYIYLVIGAIAFSILLTVVKRYK